MTKHGEKPFDDLTKAIFWKPYPDANSDPYDDEYVQIQLKARLAALFKRYGIAFSDYPGAWPPINPAAKQSSHTCFGSEKIDPFFNLAVALACEHEKGMQIVFRKAGRPSKWKKQRGQMYALAKRMKERLQNGDSESKIIKDAVNDKNSNFHGSKKTTLERRWKEFKNEKDEDNGMTNGERLGIPSSKKRKLAAEKRRVVNKASR